MVRLFIAISFFVCTTTLSAQTYEEYAQHASTYIDNKEYDAAEQSLKAALRKEPANPNNTLLLVNLGTVQRYLGKYEEALMSYDLAINKYPDVNYLLHSRATLYCEMDRMNDAVKDYTAILEKDETDVEALYRRGLIYLSSRIPKAAEEDFRRIIKLDPNNFKGQSALAMLLKRQGEWKEAEELYTDLIYKNKTNGELYFGRAECYLQLKRLARMQEDLMKATEYGYNEYPLYILRGQLRLEQFDKRLAKEDFLKALELGANKDVIDELLQFCK